jgi:hypothetical protein
VGPGVRRFSGAQPVPAGCGVAHIDSEPSFARSFSNDTYGRRAEAFLASSGADRCGAHFEGPVSYYPEEIDYAR